MKIHQQIIFPMNNKLHAQQKKQHQQKPCFPDYIKLQSAIKQDSR